MKVKDWDRGPGVDDPLGMTSVDLKKLGDARRCGGDVDGSEIN